MPPKNFRKGFIRQSLSAADRGRIPLPGWCVDCLALWGFSTGIIALALVFRNSVAVLLLLFVSALPALAGAWIAVVNLITLVTAIRAEYRSEYEIAYHSGNLRFVDLVVSEGTRSIGKSHPDARTVTERVRENPSALSVCTCERSDGKESFYGYVLLYPLKDEIGERVLSGAVRSEAEFGPEPLRHSFVGARYIYVAMVWGSDAHGRWHIKDRLREMMLEALDAAEVDLVFARPGTVFGKAMMREYGFTPIKDRDGVWSVEARRLRRRLAGERALYKAVIFSDSESIAESPNDEQLDQQQ